MPRKKIDGFTLIELAVVLVIIGLVIGGILVGRDMISTAQARATLAQLERYSTAVNTFRNKYRGLPGNMIPSDAAAYGFTTRAGGLGHGSGDGRIRQCSGIDTVQQFGCENTLFWSDLSQAGLIEGAFTQATDALLVSLTAAQLTSYMPTPKIGSGTIRVLYDSARFNSNTYYLYGVGYLDGAGIVGNGYSILTPAQAFSMDSKIDDGMPGTGSVVYQYTTGPPDGTYTSGTGFSLGGGESNADFDTSLNPGCTICPGTVTPAYGIAVCTAPPSPIRYNLSNSRASCLLQINPKW